MNSIAKLGAVGVLAAFLALVAGVALPTSATPTALTVNALTTTPQTFALGANIPVVATYQDEGANLVLTSSNPAVAYFNAFGPAAVTPLDGETITPPAAFTGTLTVTDDADATAEAKTLTANLFCAANGTTNISYTQGGGTSSTIVVNCGTGGTTTIQFSSTTPAIGVAITVTATCTGAAQPLTSSPTTSGAFGTTVTNGTYASASQVNCAAAGNMVAQYTCALAGTITFTLNGVTATITCGATGGLILSAATGYSATVSGTCATGLVLTQTGPAYFSGATLNGVAVTTGVAAGSISCSGAGTLVASLICNSTGTVSLALGGMTGTFTCTYGGTYGYNPYLNNTYPTNYCGTNTTYPYNYNATYPYNYSNQYATNNCYNQQQYTSVPTSLTIATGSPSVACGSTASVTVRVVGSNGGTVADGTAVALAASVGTLSPASASTSAGAVTATYTAPANVPATSVTLRATAGAASNTAGISISCAPTAPAASQPSSPPPSYAPAPPPAGLVISPPNTGDAGLLVSKDDNCD